jgi:hypothetical protein
MARITGDDIDRETFADRSGPCRLGTPSGFGPAGGDETVHPEHEQPDGNDAEQPGSVRAIGERAQGRRGRWICAR